MKNFILDRIEGDKAVLECEDGSFVTLERKSLPKSVREGDVIKFDSGSYFLNADETENRKKKIKALMDKLFED